MLEIKNFRVSYHELTVLQDVNLTLEKGDALSVIGESGTGKTTLGLSLLGLGEGRWTGEIMFHGKNILNFSEEERRRLRGKELSMVFQNVEGALHPLYTVLDQVVESILVHRSEEGKCLAIDRASNLLNSVGLDQRRMEAYPHQLSGGEKQRALIALALANDPEVLILDEPTAALDAVTKIEIIELLKHVGKDKIVLIITHEIATAARLTEKMAVLYGGRIVESGRTADLLANPRHPYTRGLLRSYPNMATTKDLQGIPGRMAHGIPGCPFHPRCTQKVDICSRVIPVSVNIGAGFVACHRGGIVPLLEVKGLSKYFGFLQAVHGLELSLYEGETLSLVGESGSGKTTVARMIMGLLEADTGEILLEEKKIVRRTKEFYQRVQMIFQNPSESISYRMNVLQAVKEPLDIHKSGSEEEKIDRVRRVLKEVELPGDDAFLQQYPHHLSGGEAQRVAIARALVLNPKVIIADEPTSALDASVQAKILKLLLNLQEKRGLGILLITHDLALARKVSDRIAVMRRGSIIEEGATNKVIMHPKHSYTQKLIYYAPDLIEEEFDRKMSEQAFAPPQYLMRKVMKNEAGNEGEEETFKQKGREA